MKEKVIRYLKETVVELKKVTWPTKDEVVGSTIITVVVSVVLATFIFGVDQVFSYLISLVLS